MGQPLFLLWFAPRRASLATAKDNIETNSLAWDFNVLGKCSFMSKAVNESSNLKKEETTPPKKKKGMKVKELVDKHMKDKNHIITDEEIKNLDFDLDHPDTETSHTPDLPDDKNRPKDEDKDPKIITPWDTIN